MSELLQFDAIMRPVAGSHGLLAPIENQVMFIGVTPVCQAPELKNTLLHVGLHAACKIASGPSSSTP